MIDIDQIIAQAGEAGETSGHVPLLASRAIIEACFPTPLRRPNGACCTLYRRCLSEVSNFTLPSDPRRDAGVIGWLNLFVESCRLTRPPLAGCSDCGLTPGEVADQPLAKLLATFTCLPARSAPEQAVSAFSQLFAPELVATTWSTRQAYWSRLGDLQTHWERHLTASQPNNTRLGDTDLVQTLVMHLLEVLLPLYESLQLPNQRAILHIILVPLLRVLFRSPHRAHVVYERYFFGVQTVPEALFHRLYGYVQTTETFKSLSTSTRSSMLGRLVAGSDVAERETLLDQILHSERHKKTFVGQLSLLVKSSDQPDSETIAYTTHFPTSKVTFLTDNGLSKLSQEHIQFFNDALQQSYRDGHGRDALEVLFGTTQGQARVHLPVWLHDGEVTLTQILLSKEIDWTHFFTEDGALPKAWALVNFLERVLVSSRPQFYTSGPINAFIGRVYEALEAKPLRQTTLKNAISSCLGALTEQAQRSTRLRVAAPEFALRGHGTPVSLFVYPISGVRRESLGAPEAFIGGSLAGCGAGCLPDVTAAYDYHLYASLDALGPMMDAAIADVLSHRLLTIQTATQSTIAREITPIVKELSGLLSRANNRLIQVESAVDLDWSGLFGEALGSSISAVFDERGWLRFEGIPGLSDCAAQQGNHAKSTDVQSFLKELLYIVYTALLPSKALPREGSFASGAPASKGEQNLDQVTSWEALCTSAGASTLVDEWMKTDTGIHLASRHPWMNQFLVLLNQRQTGAVQQLRSLLKLLTVRSLDSARPLHPVQVASALGLRGYKNVEGLVAYYNGDVRSTFRSAFDLAQPDPDPGLARLVTVIEGLDEDEGVRLSARVSPAHFLRALRALAGGPLRSGRGGSIGLASWQVAYRRNQARRAMLVAILCKGRFDSDTKRAIAEYSHQRDHRYHDLRSNLRTLLRAVDGHPVFLADVLPNESEFADPDALWAFASGMSSNFSMVEGTKQNSNTVFLIRFGGWGVPNG